MPRKAADVATEQTPSNQTENAKDDTRASMLVFISAKAIGSFGFAISLFAIWLGWILPASIAAQTAEEHEVRKSRPSTRHSRRLSRIVPIIVPPPTPMRRASEPMHVTPILASQPEDASATPRRVYFEDSSISPITRRNTLPEPNQSARLLEARAVVDATVSPFFTSPLATSSALPPQDVSDDHPADSDSSPHSSKASSLKSTSRLQKLKLFGNKTGLSHRPEALDKPSDQGSIASTETSTSEKSARRASGSFVAGWTLSRNRGTLPDVTAGESSTPSPSRLSFSRRMSPSRPVPSPSTATPTSAGMPSELLSPTFLTRKSQKRVSAPIPRTSPYGAPYFAAPPLLLDSNYQAYLKTLPQFEDEIKTATSQTFDDEPERGRGRTSSIRRVNLRSLPPKPRSASVDMTTRRDVIA